MTTKFATKIPTIRRLSAFQKDAGSKLVGGHQEILIDPQKVRYVKQIRNQDSPGFSTESLEQLGASMKRDGQHQAAVVRTDPAEAGFYLMIAGERRGRAAEMASLQLRVVVRDDLTEEQVRRVQRSENIDRENLTQLEVAAALKEDKERLGTLEKVAVEWQRSIAWVAERLTFLEAADAGGAAAEILRAGASSDIAAITDLHRLDRINPGQAAAVAQQLQETDSVNARQLVRENLRAAKGDKAGKKPEKTVARGAASSPAQGQPHQEASDAKSASNTGTTEQQPSSPKAEDEAPISTELRRWLDDLDVAVELRAFLHPVSRLWFVAVNEPTGLEFGSGFASLDGLVKELTDSEQAGKVIIDMGTVLALSRTGNAGVASAT